MGKNFQGSTSVYLKDVKSILERRARVLVEAVRLAPKAKWIIIGGSPCQDLTYAGPHRGLGHVGPCSSLFFCLQRAIGIMQELVGPTNVRFLVENAGSMQPLLLFAI